MEVLRQHFRPEFINRIDEIIVFHSLNRPEIRRIVELQLDRVARTALGQGVEMAFDESVTDHFAAVGFQPEFGARELRRLIRSELETELARAMLSGSVEDGDKVRAAWSAEEQKITFEKQEVAEEDSAEPEDKPADTSGTADGDEDSEATDAKGESDASEEASAK